MLEKYFFFRCKPYELSKKKREQRSEDEMAEYNTLL